MIVGEIHSISVSFVNQLVTWQKRGTNECRLYEWVTRFLVCVVFSCDISRM